MCCFVGSIMADEFDETPAVGALQMAELPEIKLFGRWNCEDVQVNDITLQVCFSRLLLLITFKRNSYTPTYE